MTHAFKKGSQTRPAAKQPAGTSVRRPGKNTDRESCQPILALRTLPGPGSGWPAGGRNQTAPSRPRHPSSISPCHASSPALAAELAVRLAQQQQQIKAIPYIGSRACSDSANRHRERRRALHCSGSYGGSIHDSMHAMQQMHVLDLAGVNVIISASNPTKRRQGRPVSHVKGSAAQPSGCPLAGWCLPVSRGHVPTFQLTTTPTTPL